ncbi:hypothetical protein KAI65_02180 [Candidatus Parcubacteria bacterium]|nr:hypothetical protein [Candidatus Parcubacteria bacterium]
MTDLEKKVKEYSKRISAIQCKLQGIRPSEDDTIGLKIFNDLKVRIKLLVTLRKENLQELSYLEEQKKIIDYSKFCMAVILEEGEEAFCKKIQNEQEHPIVAPKFRDLFPYTEQK